MALPSDYISGTITLTNGSTAFTGTGTGWLAADFREGDIILDVEGGEGAVAVIASITSNTAGVLSKEWEGPTLTDVAYRMRYQWDSGRVSAQSRAAIEMLGNGNLQSFASITGPGVPVFDGPHSVTIKPESDFVNGVAYDVQVDTLADRDAYDGQSEGFAVLVSDVGDGRSALYSKNSNAVGDWSDPAYITGPVGPLPDVEATVTSLPPGSTATVTEVPITGGVRLDFELPEASGFYNAGVYDIAEAYNQDDVVRHNGSSFIALQSVPVGESPSSAFPPVDTAYWQVLAAKGQDGNITGVTPFWQSRILNDADAAAARAGLELVKQTSETDDTTGRLLTVGAFGVGKTASLVTPDLNSVRPSGRYYCNSPTNGPGGNGWLDVFDLDADHAYHEFTNLSGVVFSRIRSGGVWSIWQPRTEMYLNVREEQAQNVAGGAALAGANDRVLNAVKFNNIPGASVASNRITLPEGVYKVEVKSPAYAVDAFKVALLEYPSLAILLEGINAFSWSTTPSAVTFGEVTGILTVPSGGKTFFVRLYAAVAKAVNGLGVQVNRSGLVEVYTDVMIKRIR